MKYSKNIITLLSIILLSGCFGYGTVKTTRKEVITRKVTQKYKGVKKKEVSKKPELLYVPDVLNPKATPVKNKKNNAEESSELKELEYHKMDFPQTPVAVPVTNNIHVEAPVTNIKVEPPKVETSNNLYIYGKLTGKGTVVKPIPPKTRVYEENGYKVTEKTEGYTISEPEEVITAKEQLHPSVRKVKNGYVINILDESSYNPPRAIIHSVLSPSDYNMAEFANISKKDATRILMSRPEWAYRLYQRDYNALHNRTSFDDWYFYKKVKYEPLTVNEYLDNKNQ